MLLTDHRDEAWLRNVKTRALPRPKQQNRIARGQVAGALTLRARLRGPRLRVGGNVAHIVHRERPLPRIE
jgi:hypothetical protein